MPDEQALALPLEQPDVAAARLQFREHGQRLVARWVIPWGWVVFAFVTATGSISAGALLGNRFGKLGDGACTAILALLWGLFVPLLLLLLRRLLRRALRHPEHLVLDRAQRRVHLSALDGATHSIAFEQVRAMVAVSRAVKVVLHSGNPASHWTRRHEFSLLYEEPGGALVQAAMFAIQDEGGRLSELRRRTNEIPRILGCERIYVALDRSGKLRGDAQPD